MEGRSIQSKVIIIPLCHLKMEKLCHLKMENPCALSLRHLIQHDTYCTSPMKLLLLTTVSISSFPLIHIGQDRACIVQSTTHTTDKIEHVLNNQQHIRQGRTSKKGQVLSKAFAYRHECSQLTQAACNEQLNRKTKGKRRPGCHLCHNVLPL
jgi:predicted DNA-binding WGR domain protein